MPDLEHAEQGPDAARRAVPDAAAVAATLGPAVRGRAAGGRLDPSACLALQRAAGNAAVRRIIARQPAGDTGLLNPNADATPTTKPDVAALRRRLLDTLDSRDAILFLSRVRALDAGERAALGDDGEFWTELRKRLGALALWSVRVIVRYGPNAPPEVNELSVAINAGDHHRTRTLLMGYGALKAVPGLRDVIAARFPAAQADDLRAILAENETRAESGHATYREAMYDAGVVKKYTGDRNYELARLSDQVRVIVRIRLKEDPANTQTGATDQVIAKWEAAISRRWNGRFRLRNGATTLDLWFVPVFVYHDDLAHHQVDVIADNQRADESNWHSLRDPDMAAHEFGHMLGNPDEYGLPGTMAEIPAALGLTDAEKRRSSWEGIFGTAKPANTTGYDVQGLLGDRYASQVVAVRHVADIVDTFNAKLRRPGEGAWTAELKP